MTSAKKQTCVVYVTYMSGGQKEYAYLCNFPVRQGDIVLGNNGAQCRVVRTADFDNAATKWVQPRPDAAVIRRDERKKEIYTRLMTLQKEQQQLELFQSLARKNPEARKLLAELKRIK